MFALGDFVRVTETMGIIGDPVEMLGAGIMFKGAPAIIIAVDPENMPGQSEIRSADCKQAWIPDECLELIQECPP